MAKVCTLKNVAMGKNETLRSILRWGGQWDFLEMSVKVCIEKIFFEKKNIPLKVYFFWKYSSRAFQRMYRQLLTPPELSDSHYVVPTRRNFVKKRPSAEIHVLRQRWWILITLGAAGMIALFWHSGGILGPDSLRLWTTGCVTIMIGNDSSMGEIRMPWKWSPITSLMPNHHGGHNCIVLEP